MSKNYQVSQSEFNDLFGQLSAVSAAEMILGWPSTATYDQMNLLDAALRRDTDPNTHIVFDRFFPEPSGHVAFKYVSSIEVLVPVPSTAECRYWVKEILIERVLTKDIEAPRDMLEFVYGRVHAVGFPAVIDVWPIVKVWPSVTKHGLRNALLDAGVPIRRHHYEVFEAMQEFSVKQIENALSA